MQKKNVYYITHQMTGALKGGAETQIFETMRAINDHNDVYNIHLFNHWTDSLSQADLIHIFNPTGFPFNALEIVEHARKIGIPVVVSPIYYYVYNKNKNGPVAFFLNKIFNDYHNIFKYNFINYFNPENNIKKIFHKADLLVPNSDAEMNQIIQRFNLNKEKVIKVPNGVNTNFINGNPDQFVKEYGEEGIILFVGRIEPRKNVLNLIRAYDSLKLKSSLFIIGDAPDPCYYQKCKSIASEKVKFVGKFDYNSPILSSAYSAAKVVVLPSYFETPGITALEGGLAGSNVVITKYGGTEEYFKNFAWYVEPSSIEDISEKISEAYHTSKNNGLSAHIETHYSWKAVGNLTASAYDDLIERQA